ncbi:HAMP domain-containing sensor histidine kinase [Brachybacterium phenoliresistens]|uniref:sensor histidine kinase n=1 Tax=Brachybacterium phenoliresistens TaxID=396014 RepID=UPI0031DF9CDB
MTAQRPGPGPTRWVRRALRGEVSGPVAEMPMIALGHQLTLSACLVIGSLLLDGTRIERPRLYWGGDLLVHALTLLLVIGMILARRSDAGAARFERRALFLVPVLDLLVLAVARWGLVDAPVLRGALMTLPAVWLAAQLRYRGVGLALGISVMSVVVGLVIAPGQAMTVLARGFSLTLLIGALGMVVASIVSRLDETSRRNALIADAIGAVEVVIQLDGSLRSRGRLKGAGRDVPVQELLDDPVFTENGRYPVRPDRNPLARVRGGAELDGQAVWTEADGNRIALSISSTRLDDGRMLMVVHDVTTSLAAVLQEEQFLAGISHELKTPLTSIAGYVELLADEAEDADAVPSATVRSHLGVVSRNVDRLRSLIMGLLDSARTSSDHIGSASAPEHRTSLTRLVAEQIEAIGPRARGRGLSIVTAGLEEDVELVNADPERLGQAVDNLLSNAVTYSHDQGTIRVSLAVDEGRARLQVADEGIGIDAEDLDSLFTPYFRARSATRAGISGNGLGLMITRRIVRAHGGEVEISSTLGQGTAITLVLPLART